MIYCYFCGKEFKSKHGIFRKTHYSNEHYEEYHNILIDKKNDEKRPKGFSKNDLKKIKLGEEFGWFCVGCCKILDIFTATLDHIIPQSKGGVSNSSNYQLMCGPCNVQKGDNFG